jgi:hypothetical protein
MKLDIVCESFDIIEARLRIYGCIEEADEAPRWGFDYSNFRTDPSPDILVLGDWIHPNTGNHLIGGINLHYLDTRQRDELSKILPALMKQNDLYERYWTGRKLLPYVFHNFYRTYNAAHIHGLERSTLYPKYGYTKAAFNWVKDKLSSLFKSKEQRETDKLPKYPSDLTGVEDNLEVAVKQAQRSVSGDISQPEKPKDQTPQQKLGKRELDRKKAISKQQHVTHKAEPTPNINDIKPKYSDDIPDLQLKQAEYEENNPSEFSDENIEVNDEQIQRAMAAKAQQAELTKQKAEQTAKQKIHDDFMTDVENNRKENMGESIKYYSPKHKKYIIEYINLA